ncbi:TetR/AcrR family transcriptional regulator [Nocardia macrotermitis]|uniref:Putative HTH-type transcriptional regulator n=1 Tax=Nocardia macrotermitis TaxID=2585198 RepID=A0A7K0D7U7_9NOCA|nr:TetR/AcrR family transcriptional regulator [Nocardia macrotermitis]MQY21649.1 putative HTH-type transcriptional regulator [Nocardia macrotermitis]
MSIKSEAGPSDRPTRSKAATVRALLDATVEVLRTSGYEALTIKSAAAHAGIGRATAYGHFGSRNHLVAEVYWHRISSIDAPSASSADVRTRAAILLRQLALLMSDEPALARAVTVAMCNADPDTEALRSRIGYRVHQLITAAVADDGTAELVEVLEDMYFGALVRAGTADGYSYTAVAAHLEHAVLRLFGDQPEPSAQLGTGVVHSALIGTAENFSPNGNC